MARRTLPRNWSKRVKHGYVRRKVIFAACIRCGTKYEKKSNNHYYCGSQKKRSGCSWERCKELMIERGRRLYKEKPEAWMLKRKLWRENFMRRNPNYMKNYREERKKKLATEGLGISQK